MIAFLRYLGASYPLAADLVQDTMVKAHPPAWGKIVKPHAWCRKVCWNAYRYHVSHLREIAVSDLQEYGNPLITSDSRLKELDEYRGVIAALQRLPPRRRAVMAFYYDGATTGEIATALGIDPATVRSTYRNAKRDLAQILREPDWDTDQ